MQEHTAGQSPNQSRKSELQYTSTGSLGGNDIMQECTVGQSPHQSKKSSEGMSNMETPLSYDFLGSQHGAIAKQQQRIDEIKMWQKHFPYQAHLQELHRLQQAVQLNQYSRQQQQLKQLMADQKQSLGDQLPPLLHGSSLHELQNFVHPSNQIQRMELASNSSSLLPGAYEHCSAGNLANGSPSLHGSPTELLVSQEPNSAWQVLAFNGAPLDVSAIGPSSRIIKDADFQPLDLHSNSTGMMLETFGEALTTASQVGKPITSNPGLGAFIVGNQQAPYFDPSSAQNDASCVGQLAPSKSLSGQSLNQNFSQTIESGWLLSNLQQENAVCRNSQQQDFVEKQQQKSCAREVEQKDNLQFVHSHGFVNSDSSLETVSCNSQQARWPSLNTGQAGTKLDSRTQSTSAGHYAHEGGYQSGNNQVLNNLATKQQGSWSALMQSAVAEISSLDAGQQVGWSSFHMQENPSDSDNTLQLLPNEKQQSIQLPTSFTGNPHLANRVDASTEVQCLQQTCLQSSDQLNFECIQPNNQTKLQSGVLSQSLCEAPLHACGWKDQSSHQLAFRGNSNLQFCEDFEETPQSIWKPINMNQVTVEGKISSLSMNMEERQHNSSRGDCQGYSETESSQRVLEITSNGQSYWNMNAAQGNEQNSVWLNENSNEAHEKHGNEDAICSSNEQNVVQNTGKLNHKRRHNLSNDILATVQFPDEQDQKMKAYLGDQYLQQETICTGIFSQGLSTDNLQSNMERHQRMPERNPLVFGSKHATLLNNSERLQEMSQSNYHLTGTKHATVDSVAKMKGVESTSIQGQSNSSQVWNPVLIKSYDSGQESISVLSRAQGDAHRNTHRTDYSLQSILNGNQWAQSQLSRQNDGRLGHSRNEIMGIASANVLQQPLRTLSSNQWHAESAKHASSSGVSDLDMQGHKASEKVALEQPNMVGSVSRNSYTNTGMEELNIKLQTDVKEMVGRGFLKDISSGHASISSPALDRSLNFTSLKKTTSLSSITSEILSKAVHSVESNGLKGMVCTEQDVSVEKSGSSLPDIPLSHSYQTQSLNPLSSQGFPSLSSPSQPSQILQHGLSVHLDSCSQATQGLDVKETCSTKEDEGEACIASAIHQVCSSKVFESDKTVGLSQSSLLASLSNPTCSSSELSSTATREKVVGVRQNTSVLTASEMQTSGAQVHDSHHIIAGQRLTSLPHVAVSHAFDQRQIDTHGSLFTNKVRGLPGVTPASQMVNSLMICDVTQKEPEMQTTFCPSTRSLNQIGSPVNVLSKECQGVPRNHYLLNERNVDQSWQEPRASSISQPVGMSGMSQVTSFAKLLSKIKNLANQQRKSLGAEKTFPSVFESFRPLVGRFGNNFQFLPTKSDGHIGSGKLSTSDKSAASMCTRSYGPYIVNSQQPASVEKLTNQGHFFHHKVSEKVGSSGIPMSSSSSEALSITVINSQGQGFATNPQVGSQGQAQECCLMPRVYSSVPSSVASLYSVIDNQECTKAIIDQCSHVTGSTCPLSPHKNDSGNADPVVSEDLGTSDVPSQQNVCDGPMPVTTEQNNEDDRTVKVSDIADASCHGTGTHFKGKPIQQAVSPNNWLGPANVVAASNTAQWQASLPEDATTLPSSASSPGSKEKDEEVPSHIMVSSMSSQLQNKDYKNLKNESSQSSLAGRDICQVITQLANSGVLRLGSATNEELLALQVATMCERMVVSGVSPVITSRPFLPGKNIERMFPDTSGQVTEAALKEAETRASVQISNVAGFSPTEDDSIHQYSSSISNIGPSVTVIPKKRKKVILPLRPWRIEITESGGQLPSISDAELAWATATNRQPEKDEAEIEFCDEEAGSVSRAKRRLILASQLMQQLVPPLPAVVMGGKATVEHESATYILAKTSLGDACKLGSSLRAFGHLPKFKRSKDTSILRIMERFMGRARDLANELQRLETSPYMSELRSESRDLERLSITNRLAKHHARSFLAAPAKGITERRESPSDSALSIRKLCPHRYVTAVPMPKNLPEGVLCFSL
eukprot:Gb_16170 [translate_table: standard]